MKIIISILLIFSFVIPFGGSYIILQFQKQIIKKEIKQKIIKGIDKNELVILRFKKDETFYKLKWEDSKEFEYEGEMYDIVECTEANDTITYWCWLDHAETKLNKQFDALINKNTEQNPLNQENIKRVTRFLNALYSQKIFEFKCYYEKQIFTKLIETSFYKSLSIPPPIPPP